MIELCALVFLYEDLCFFDEADAIIAILYSTHATPDLFDAIIACGYSKKKKREAPSELL